MPVRRFDATDDQIVFSLGSTGLTGAFTIAVLYRPDNVAGECGLVMVRNSSNSEVGPCFGQGGSEQLIAKSGGTTRFSGASNKVVNDQWVLAVVTKAAGTTAFRWHLHVYDETPAWTHANNGSTLGDPSSTVGGNLIVGPYEGERAIHDKAAEAMWSSALTDEQVEALGSVSALSEWAGLGAVMLHLYNQAAVTTAVEDQVGSCDQTSRVGTEVIAEEPPIPYEAEIASPRRLTLLGAGQ